MEEGIVTGAHPKSSQLPDKLRYCFATTAIVIIAAISLAGCAGSTSSPTSTVSDILPFTPVTICGQNWTPGAEVPSILQLTNTAPEPSAAPGSSALPSIMPGGNGSMEIAAFRFGDCSTGAIITVRPLSAVVADNVIYAADGSIAFLTLCSQPGMPSWQLQAWSSADGTYLGEYTAD